MGRRGLNRALLSLMQPGRNILDTVSAFPQARARAADCGDGRRHRLSTLLRGLKAHSTNITAIVSVADDGSSRECTAVLAFCRRAIRNCLTALADDETLMGQLFQYRFAEGNGLSGHRWQPADHGHDGDYRQL